MRVSLGSDPQVLAIADYLSESAEFWRWFTDGRCDSRRDIGVTDRVTISVTIHGLLVTWGVARDRGEFIGDDLVLSHSNVDTISRISGIPGFGQAMAKIQWLEDLGDGRVCFPKALIHMTSPEERKRMKAAERQRRARDKRRDSERDMFAEEERDASRECHAGVTPRVEESREEEITTPPISPPGNEYPPAFERLWEIRPRRAGNDPKPRAYRAWKARIDEGKVTEEQARAKVQEYARFCEATGKIGTETVMQLASFFGPQTEGYLQEWVPPRQSRPGPGADLSDANYSAGVDSDGRF